MSVEKMSHVKISGDVHFLEEVFFICEMDNNFHPVEAMKTKNSQNMGKISKQNPYTKMMQQIIDIGVIAGIDVREDFINKDKKTPNDGSVGCDVEQHINKFKQVINTIIPGSMDEYTPADILSLNHIKTFIGHVPKEYIERFRNLKDDKFLFIEGTKEQNDYWCIYFTTKDNVEYCQEYMLERGFCEIWLPTFASTEHDEYDCEYEDKYIHNFYDQIKCMLDEEEKAKQTIEQYSLAIDHIDKFNKVMNIIMPNKVDNDTSSGVLELDHIKTLIGCVPKENIEKFRNLKDDKFLFIEGIEEKDQYWCIYFTANEHIEYCHKYMKSRGFNEICLQIFEPTEHSSDNSKETKIKQALKQIENMRNIPICVEDDEKEVKIRFGRLPIDSLSKLNIYSETIFTFKLFTSDNRHCWGMYTTNDIHEQEADKIFKELLFERVSMPQTDGDFQSSMKSLFNQIIGDKQEELDNLQAVMAKVVSENHEHLVESYYKTKFLNDSFEIRKYVEIEGDIFYFEGFIPTADEAMLRHEFHTISEVTVEIVDAEKNNRVKVPTKLKNNKFSKPFECLVEMYGVPSYGDFDPTNVLAITYTLLYGIMFGDLGQGLLLVLFGYLLFKKTGNSLGQIMMRIGVASSIFGVAYGSVFGFEYVLDPFFINVLGMSEKPIHIMDPITTTKILIVAVVIGCGLNIMAMTINVAIGFGKKDYTRAVFSCNGIVGIFMYGGVLAGVALTMLAGINVITPIYIIGVVVIPLVMILFAVPLGNLMAGKKEDICGEEGLKGIATEGIFELFEVVLSFISNTMSFLRVGGFILSHAGMMLVVMTLYEMVGGIGGIVVLIVGNLFVIGLEGFIVGIQALRLEFYEMFSRYYEGDGLVFSPITIKK